MDSHGGSDGDTATNDNDEDVAVVPQVQINDVAFAWHALVLATITFVQLAWFSGGRGGSGSTSPSTVNTHQKDTLLYWTNRISPTTKFLILILLVVCVAGAIIVACHVSIWIGGERSQWQWIDYLYFLSFVKVGISIVKYIPQVRYHWPVQLRCTCFASPLINHCRFYSTISGSLPRGGRSGISYLTLREGLSALYSLLVIP